MTLKAMCGDCTALGLLVLGPTAAVAQPVGAGGTWAGGPWAMHAWGWGWGCGFAWLLAFGAIAALAVVLLRRRAAGKTSGTASPAIDALDLRYARGEIDRDEYLRRRADILGAG